MPHVVTSACVGLDKAVATSAQCTQPCRYWYKPCLRHSFRASKTCKRQRLLTIRGSSATEATEHAQYIQDVAATDNPERLTALLKVLQAQEMTKIAPTSRDGLHPLMIPLATQESQHGTVYTGLLRQVSLSGNDKAMPVVQMTPCSTLVTLAARNIDEYLHRALAAEDIASGPGTIAEAAGEAGHQLYTAGTAKDNLNAYLTRKAGMYADVVEQLVANHLQKDDNMSALITAEWYMRPKHFPGWGRPYEFAAGLYQRLGRLEESRDSARVALRLPWWSLASGFAATRDLAGLQGSAIQVHKALTEQTMAANGALPPGVMPAKDNRQVLIEDADFAMNTVAAGEASWNDIRSRISDKYQEAGLQELAKFVVAVC